MTDHLAIAIAARIPPPAERQAFLLAWADAIEREAEATARTITTATRKPITFARLEVKRGIGTLRGTAAAMPRLDPERFAAPAGGTAEIRRRALGPVLAVTPFNFPLNLSLHKLAPALAAGCPVIWKPSPHAPGVAETALRLMPPMPAGLVQLVHLDNDAVAALVADERLALLSFTGSAPVGFHLKRLATRTQVMLELGGNAAVVVHRVADVATAAARIAFGACLQAGQACNSVQRVFVPADEPGWAEALTAAFRALPTGDPWDEATVCGPVIDAAAKARIERLIEGYRARGGQLLCGGTWRDLVLAPTLVDGLPASDPEVRGSEAFAPLATLHRCRDLDEALALAEDTPFGLQAGILTDDPAAAERAAERLRVGTMVIGDIPTRRDDALPYGGTKGSGNGREGTLATLLAYTEAHVVWRIGPPPVG